MRHRLAPAALLILLGSAAALHATYSFDFVCRTDTVQRVDPGGAAEFNFTITNTGDQSDGYRFDCRVLGGVPDWFVTYCVGGRCGEPGMVLYETLAAGAVDTTAHISVYTSSTPGQETVNLRIQSLGEPSLIDSATTYTLAGAVIEELPPRPRREEFSLSIRPNPVSGRALISYMLPAGSVEARLALYDAQGRRRLTVAVPGSGPGCHESHWRRPGRLPGGVYILRLSCGRQSVCHKMVVED